MAAPRSTWTLLRSAFRPSPFLRQSAIRPAGRRTVAGVAIDPAVTGPERTGFAKLWNSPIGPKTVHFWAPIMKWGVVLAGVSNFFISPEKLSMSQNLALVATGAIWTRWCFVIRPKNLFLATVNFFVFLTGAMQATRIFLWRKSQDGLSTGEELKLMAKEEGHAIESVVMDPKGAMQKAEKSI